jgi:hypothetical protein
MNRSNRPPLPLLNPEPWQLLTPLNISTRQLWPWGHSIQKFIHTSEPRPRGYDNILIASDYGGAHKNSTHIVYCFLVVGGGGSNWLAQMRPARDDLLPDGRTMSYKRLGDPKRQVALGAFLSAAAQLDGHLVAIAVDKKKKWLSTQPNSSEKIRAMLGLKCAWNPMAFEDMIRKVQIASILISLWSKPGTNVTWITDQDAFVANDKRHDDALTAVARMTSLYNTHPMGVFRLNTTDQDEDSRDYEDLCAIPDLAAGMMADVTMRLTKDSVRISDYKRALNSSLPDKAEIIADWFWASNTRLRKTLITIETEGDKYRVQPVWMSDSSAA